MEVLTGGQGSAGVGTKSVSEERRGVYVTTGCYIPSRNTRVQPIWLFRADTNYLRLQKQLKSILQYFKQLAMELSKILLTQVTVLKYNFQELYFLLHGSSTLHSFDTFSY